MCAAKWLRWRETAADSGNTTQPYHQVRIEIDEVRSRPRHGHVDALDYWRSDSAGPLHHPEAIMALDDVSREEAEERQRRQRLQKRKPSAWQWCPSLGCDPARLFEICLQRTLPIF